MIARSLDLQKFAMRLVPPVLRRTRLLAVLRTLVLPITHLYDRYNAYALTADVTTKVTPQKFAMLQRVVMMGQDYTGVRIKNGQYNARTSEFMHFAEEQQPRYLYFQVGDDDNTPWYYRLPDEFIYGASFVVEIPKKHQLSDVSRNVKAVVDRYKAAGTSYKIEWYESGLPNLPDKK